MHAAPIRGARNAFMQQDQRKREERIPLFSNSMPLESIKAFSQVQTSWLANFLSSLIITCLIASIY